MPSTIDDITIAIRIKASHGLTKFQIRGIPMNRISAITNVMSNFFMENILLKLNKLLQTNRRSLLSMIETKINQYSRGLPFYGIYTKQ